MATLLVAAAVNIAVGLALNALFPPPDIDQEGPRLSDLGFTSATYGKFVNIPFGTDRMDGNIIDTEDPPIEEVVTEKTEDAGGKGGGGPDVNTTTYTYFFTGRISFCIEGATSLIRMWADGKVVFDATDPEITNPARAAWRITFYPGGPDQLQDPEEVARRGVNIPAYRHLTSVKLDRCPLADFGNRIPNFTAEVSFNISSVSQPFLALTEPAGMDVPGSPTGADVTYMSINPFRNEVYSLKNLSAGAWVANTADLTFKGFVGSGAISEPGAGWDGFFYTQRTGNNSSALKKLDIDTGEEVGSEGVTGLGLVDVLTPDVRFGNAGRWYQLNSNVTGAGTFSTVFHLNTGFGNANGAVVDGDNMIAYHILSTVDGLASSTPLSGKGIPDHDRGRFFIIQNDSAGDEYRLVKYTPRFEVGIGGVGQPSIATEVVRQFTRGTFAAGDDFEGTGNMLGWAVNRDTGDLLLGNGTSAILYNPDTDTILAQRLDVAGFQGEHNYFTGQLFAWFVSSSNPANAKLTIIDTRTLDTISEVFDPAGSFGWTGNNVLHEQSQVWDDRSKAIVFSREEAGGTAPADQRILKQSVNKLTPLDVGLDEIALALSTTYQRQVMAGLDPSDVDVTTLAGDAVTGYTLTRRSTMKSALEPLRQRYQFDVIQSDWGIKFPKRGGSPVLTIPEEDAGVLKRGRSQTDEPPVQENRTDDLSLPMSMSVRYKNKDSDYQIDTERDKRHLFPNPTMRSKTERTLDVPLVDTPTNMKRLAQRHLVAAWNERISYKTIIPWTYIKLDPSDVFNLGVFGETAQVRMLENDLGAGWAIEITGVVEDTAQYSSTLDGGTSPGHVRPKVPSNLPTRFIPLDAPILSTADFLLTPFSNAYVAASAFEGSWPGCSIGKSADGVQFNNTASINVECVLAKVRTAPGAWNLVNGDFPNRIQEVVDGGSMTLTGIRRSEFWASVTELNMLAGANSLAVRRASDGQVEIVSYVDVVDNGDNTFTLNRLLRGRLGTEDVADLGISVGDEIVGLRDVNNVAEAAPIGRQNLPLTELDTPLFFRAVTIGSPANEAEAIANTYTGRDLKPYFPADIQVVSDGSGGLDVSWQRRTRGPFTGEWLDGTGLVPLNETIEQYEVTLANLGGDFITKVVDDATTVNFTKAELDSGGAPGGIAKQIWPTVPGSTIDGSMDITGSETPFVNGNWVLLDGPDGFAYTNGVTGSISGPVPGSETRVSPTSTHYLRYAQNSSDSFREAGNTIELVRDVGMDSVDIAISTARANIWVANGRTSDSLHLQLHVLDSDDNILASVTQNGFRADAAESGVNVGDWISVGSIYDAALDPWPQRNLGITMDQPGAAKLRFDCGINKGGTTFSTGLTGYDHLEIEIVAPPPDMTVKVVQVSESGKKSPIAARQVT